MIYYVDLQLGAKDQAIHCINEVNPETTEEIFRVPIPELGSRLCDLYFANEFSLNNKVVLSGPQAISLAVQEDIYEAMAKKYRKEDINIELI